MSVKVILSWDIAPEKEQEYFEFVIREFIPGVQRLGFDLSDAWATVYGSRPQIQVGATLDSEKQARQIIRSTEWKQLNEQLQGFVTNYRLKMVSSSAGFQF